VLAGLDLEGAAGPRPGTLKASALLDLAPARRRNALAEWLRGLGLPSPGARRLAEIAGPMLRARADRQPRIVWPGGELRRHRGLLHAGVPGVAAPDPALSVGWQRPGPLSLPHGRLLVEAGPGGLDPQIWARGPVRVGLRQGGERCRPAGAPHRRSLKKLLQERGLPPWERTGLPLVFVGGELAAVGDLWVCEGFQSPPGRPGWRLRWMPSCALALPSMEGGADAGARDPGGSPAPGSHR
jgi:tRNA(Ile)-lysidine synthase